MTRDYDSTVARMAGNIAAGFISGLLVAPEGDLPMQDAAGRRAYIVRASVEMARAIIEEVKRTEAAAIPPLTGWGDTREKT